MDEQSCGICTENFNELKPSCKVLSHTCNKHLYHNKCILDWYRVIMNSKTKRPACPLCANVNIPFEEGLYWDVLRKYHFESSVIKESLDYPLRLDTIPHERCGIIVNQNRLFEMIRKKELADGSKITEYEANYMQFSHHLYYDGPKMYKLLRTCYYDPFNYRETYITGDRDDYVVPASIGPIIESHLTNNVYMVVNRNEYGDGEKDWVINIYKVIMVLCLIIICLALV
jgi:Ring finger domain